MNLTKSQENLTKEVYEFLFNDEKYFSITGSAGVGKTFIVKHILDDVIPKYNKLCSITGITNPYESIHCASTTNKAAAVFSEFTGLTCKTIHSLLGLTVMNNYSDGSVSLKKSNSWNVISNSILFIDEASMVDPTLFAFIKEGTHNCKIIFIGDACQLSAVKASSMPVYSGEFSVCELTEQVRSASEPVIEQLSNQLKSTVETGIFKDIQLHPGVIEYLEKADLQEAIDIDFRKKTTAHKILTYTNNRSIQYNDYIKNLRGLKGEHPIGEWYVVNSAYKITGALIYPEQKLFLKRISPFNSVSFNKSLQIPFTIYQAIGNNNEEFNVVLPDNKDELTRKLKKLKRNKDWSNFFTHKENILDLRMIDSSTVHKAQGSTYNTVYIDLSDLGVCRNPNLLSRLLYVACSRASNRIVFTGSLPEKYGRLLC